MKFLSLRLGDSALGQCLSFMHPLRDKFALLSTELVQKIGPGLRDLASTRTRDHTTFFVTLPVHGKGKPKNIFLSAPTSFYGCFFRSSRQNGKLDTRSSVTFSSAATDNVFSEVTLESGKK